MPISTDISKLLIVWLLISTLSFLSCKKDPELPICVRCPEQCLNVQDPKGYFDFKVGSFWVFEEESSLEIDSQYVTQNSTDNNSYFFITKIFSVYDTYSYTYWSTIRHGCPSNGLFENSLRCVNVVLSKAKPGEFISESIRFFYNIVPGDFAYVPSTSYEGNKITLTNYFPTYDVNGTAFQGVYELSEDHNSAYNNQATKHYYAHSVGLVKYELIDSSKTWTLTNYDIIK